MKRLMAMAMVAMVGLGGWAPGAIAQTVAYRDAEQNVYFDRLKPGAILEVYYDATTASARNRYQSVWMYRQSDQPCTIHQLFSTKKNFQFYNQITLKSVTPADVTFALLSIPSAGTNPALCNGANVNLSLPWKVIAPGVRAHRAYVSCFRTVSDRHTGAPICIGEDVINVAGLPGPAYQAISPVSKKRMAKVNGCGFVKLPNSTTWAAYANDVITLQASYPDYQYFGNFTRANLPIKTFAQIPKCFDGKRFMYQP